MATLAPRTTIRFISGASALPALFTPAPPESEIDLTEWKSVERAHRLDCPQCATGTPCGEADVIRRGEDRPRDPAARARASFLEDPAFLPGLDRPTRRGFVWE
jgi:hypothetical protein